MSFPSTSSRTSVDSCPSHFCTWTSLPPSSVTIDWKEGRGLRCDLRQQGVWSLGLSPKLMVLGPWRRQPPSNLALQDVQITSSLCPTAACLGEGPSGVGRVGRDRQCGGARQPGSQKHHQRSRQAFNLYSRVMPQPRCP